MLQEISLHLTGLFSVCVCDVFATATRTGGAQWLREAHIQNGAHGDNIGTFRDTGTAIAQALASGRAMPHATSTPGPSSEMAFPHTLTTSLLVFS